MALKAVNTLADEYVHGKSCVDDGKVVLGVRHDVTPEADALVPKHSFPCFFSLQHVFFSTMTLPVFLHFDLLS